MTTAMLATAGTPPPYLPCVQVLNQVSPKPSDVKAEFAEKNEDKNRSMEFLPGAVNSILPSTIHNTVVYEAPSSAV